MDSEFMTPTQLLFSVLAASQMAVGCSVSGFLIFAFLRQPNVWTLLKQSHNYGPFLLVLVSFVWATTSGIVFITNIINNQLLFGWCQFCAVSVAVMCGGSITGQMAIAVERYMKIMHEREFPAVFFWLFSAISFGFLFVLVVIQLTLGSGSFTRQESGIWCLCDFTSTLIFDRVVSLGVIVFCFVSVWLMFYTYINLYIKTKHVTEPPTTLSSSQNHLQVRFFRFRTTGSGTTSSRRQMSTLEQRVFFRCVAILTSFTCFYVPITMSFLYKSITHQPIRMELEFFLMMWAQMDCIVTPIIVCFMHAELKAAITALFPQFHSQNHPVNRLILVYFMDKSRESGSDRNKESGTSEVISVLGE